MVDTGRRGLHGRLMHGRLMRVVSRAAPDGGGVRRVGWRLAEGGSALLRARLMRVPVLVGGSIDGKRII